MLIPIPEIRSINAEALDQALKGISAKCKGLVFDGELKIVADDDIKPDEIELLIAAARSHDPRQLTPEQQKLQQGKLDADALKNQIDQALSDLQAAKNAFQATPTLANAGPLLILLANTVIGILKALRYLFQRMAA